MTRRGHRPRHFAIEELVPPEFLREYTERILWGLLDSRLLWTIDALRDIYGPLVANTWHGGGEHAYRGLRPHDCHVGAPLSDHKYGRAVDLVPVHATSEQMREDIRRDAHPEAFQHLTVVELDTHWLHIGFRNIDNSDGIIWIPRG
ncbi:peptidase M15 [Desulfohalovibrio reitneri]|uniref:peptidase M15 n=1 Tax=Desulfohalovibrio reitneri TaxID=1307759 RepID=UPI0005520509|nr:peptidase M15 [Desulfohalovibrio reitneri]